MKITLISPRLAVQKGDFLGSGVPYMPLELAIVAAFLREQGDHICVIDLFGNSPTTLESRRDHYLQGEPFTKFLYTPEIEQADLVIIYAISVMSHQEILAIIRDLRQSHPQMAIAVLENSQAVRDLRKNRIPVIVEERRLPKAMLLDTITLKENRDDTSSNCTSYV